MGVLTARKMIPTRGLTYAYQENLKGHGKAAQPNGRHVRRCHSTGGGGHHEGIAEQTRNGYTRSIRPVGTLADGDTIYASACGSLVEADINMVGTLAAEVMEKAIEDAIRAAKIDDANYLPYWLPQ